MLPLAKPVNKTGSEEEPSRSKLSSLWLPFLYMLIENGHNLAILAPINFLKPPFCSSRPSDHAPIKVLPHLPPCGEYGEIGGDLTYINTVFPY